MTEGDVIARSPAPVTAQDIATTLSDLGIERGETILMHVALSALGWVCVGAQTVIAATLQHLGPEGTLVMPGFSGQLSDPAHWSAPPVPPEWVSKVRAAMPLFDRDATPTRGLGRTPEAFRALPHTERSGHPNYSFLAHGPGAASLLADHPLEFALGPTSPLGRLRNMGAKVVLLGAGFGSCTAFHLAEYAPDLLKVTNEAYPTHRKNGATLWTEAPECPLDMDRFEEIGAMYLASGRVRRTDRLATTCYAFDMAAGVAFAEEWMRGG